MARGPADGRSYKGKYKLRNPSKYVGDPNNIVYRSSWEYKLMDHLDRNSNVVAWNSEGVVIPYYSPVDGKMHRYFMDFFVKYKDKDGKITTKLIEVKPHCQTVPPKKPATITRAYKQRLITYVTNQAKWKAARLFCEENHMIFDVFTEYHLGIKEMPGARAKAK
jgi:hypothetical protein